jgi:hypothetical protein
MLFAVREETCEGAGKTYGASAQLGLQKSCWNDLQV